MNAHLPSYGWEERSRDAGDIHRNARKSAALLNDEEPKEMGEKEGRLAEEDRYGRYDR